MYIKKLMTVIRIHYKKKKIQTNFITHILYVMY